MEEKRLFEKYQPKTFDQVIGHSKAIREIKRILARGWGGRAWWISGNSGIGKKTLARLIARQGGNVIPFTREIRSAERFTKGIYNHFFRPGQYTVIPEAYIINEAHCLKKSIVRLFMELLKELPQNIVIIFTTTKAGEQTVFKGKKCKNPKKKKELLLEDNIDEDPFLHEIHLSDHKLAKPFAQRCREIAIAENLNGKPLESYIKLAQKCKNNFRQILNEIERGCMLN